MQSLAGVLSALDPSVRDSVKIISYFDALIAEKVGVDGVLRGATLLAGCPAGMALASSLKGRRVDEFGVGLSTNSAAATGWPSAQVPGSDITVWIERSGSLHINDDMVLERLALAVGITVERTAHHPAPPAIEVLVNVHTTRDEKEAAAGTLGLSLSGLAQVVVSPAEGSLGPERSAVVPTEVGILRVSLYRGESLSGRNGIGILTTPTDLTSSWRTAITALKLSTRERPIIDASELGVLLQLGNLDPADPDVAALDRLTQTAPWAIETLHAFAEAGSVRAAALILGRHHSTVHARLETISTTVGYDVQSATGRIRMAMAVSLWRMQKAYF